MKPEKNQFAKALERLQGGSDDAALALIEEYGPHLQRVVRRQLNRRLRSKYDSQDFVQMVWASFFTHPSRMRSFDEPSDLIAYLAQMARYKVIEETRKRACKKYDVNRERPIAKSEEVNEPPGDEATPSQIAIAREYWDHLMDSESERNQEIIRLRMQGTTFAEIGKRLDINERTARKVIERLVRDKNRMN